MTINLQKGQTINLEKEQYDLSSVTIGLGWDVVKVKKDVLSDSQPQDYDLDAIAFLLDSNGKVANVGTRELVGGDVIFFNNLRHASGNIYHTGDNLTGEGDGDDEQLIVQLDRLDAKYDKIVFLVSIYHGIQKGQNFGQIENAFIRAIDAKGKEMLRYDLSNDNTFNGMCSMVFGELYRKNGGWKFRAIGTAWSTDSFVSILKEKYL